MNRKKITITVVILCVCAIGGLVSRSGRLVAEPNYSESMYNVDKDRTYPLGDVNNPFLVLEIVPTLDQAQFGYFIPGCEPVDMDQVAVNWGVDTGGNVSLFTDNYVQEWYYEYASYENIPSDTPCYVNPSKGSSLEATDAYSSRTDLAARYNTVVSEVDNSVWYQEPGDENCREKGYFQKVAAGAGNYSAIPSYSGNINNSGIDSPDYKGSYRFYYKEGGDYLWVASDETPGTSNMDDKVWMERNDIFKCHRLKLNHTDKFISAVYGKSSDQFVSKVLTITPFLLESHMDLIEKADFIVIKTAQHTSATRNIWNKYSGHPEATGTNDSGALQGFKENDLTNKQAIAIVERMASSNPPGLAMEQTTLQQAGSDSNVSKLLLMTIQFEPSDFCRRFLDRVKEDTQIKGTSKLYYGGAKTDDLKYNWTNETFRWEEQADGTWKDNKDDMRYYSMAITDINVMNKIFTWNGGDPFNIQSMLKPDNISKPDAEWNRYTKEWIEYNEEDPYNPQSHTLLDALQYILNGARTPYLRILEIEGCDEFIYGSEGWEEYFAALHPSYRDSMDAKSWVHGHLQVTAMPTWEFIGSNGQYKYDGSNLKTSSSDDLTAKYDVIVIGAKQNDSNGLNGYNKYDSDSVDLGKLIYTAIGGTYSNGGDATKMLNPSGKLPTENSELMGMRHSGNDITLKKLLELQDFQRAGKPIVVAQELSLDKVDTSSKMYDLLTWSNAEKRVYTYGTERTQIHTAINKSLLEMEFSAYPTEYQGIGSPVNASDHVLKFKFTLYGEGDDYKLALYLDTNGDGVYSGSLKEKSEAENMFAALGQVSEPTATEAKLPRMKFKEVGGAEQDADSAKLSASKEGKQYEAWVELNSSYYGIIPWKLELYSEGNKYKRMSAIDYTTIRTEDAKRPTIRVLQMNPQMDMSAPQRDSDVFSTFTSKSIAVEDGESYAQFNMRRDTEFPRDPDTNNRLADLLSSKTGQMATVAKFDKFIEEDVKDFNVEIQFLFNDDWYQLFGSSLENWKDFLEDYDMLVFGFQDMCSFSEDSIFVQGVQYFIDQGKSMILSHDMLAAYAVNDGWNSYGKFNAWLRTTAGQRRAYYESTGSGTYQKSYNQVKANGGTVSFVSPENLVPAVQQTDADGNPMVDADGNPVMDKEDFSKYFVKISPENGTDDSADSSLGYEWVSEWSDNEAFNQICAQIAFDEAALGNRERGSSTNNGINKNGWTAEGRDTTFVKLSNNGQITNYPYKLNETLEVLETHMQYYQLDLEFQTQGDVNVWFTLADANDPEVAAAYPSASKGQNLYSQKDKDARNSFYIYNKGNITYTGSGHGASRFWEGVKVMPDDEVQLFINTMISAYRQPESRPYAVIDNADGRSANKTSVFYLDFDEESYNNGATIRDKRMATKVIGGSEVLAVGIEFTLYDDRPAAFWEDPKEYYIKLQRNGTDISASEVVIETAKDSNDDGAGASHLYDWTDVAHDENGTVKKSFILWVPYSDLIDNKGSVTYTIAAYGKYKKNGNDLRTSPRYTHATVMLLPLFDLN